MRILDTIAALRAARAGVSGRVGLVPTMGALHDGHLELVRQARAENDHVFVSIFVNPTQFGPNEDLTSYPRDLAHDTELLQSVGADWVFTPTPALMYPPGYQTFVTVEQVTEGLEGARRPSHFRGVATVVAKLFNLVEPDRAYFGQKDVQQVVVLRRMVADLNFRLQIVVCPTVRERDGLAMSSRNRYLKPDERTAAVSLHRALRAAAGLYEQGERHPERLCAEARRVLEAEPLAQIDYISANDPRTLEPRTQADDAPLLLSMAVQVGRPRLLDNALLPWSLNNQRDLSRLIGAVEDF
jgi:pantoate--beta-alanine ligase